MPRFRAFSKFSTGHAVNVLRMRTRFQNVAVMLGWLGCCACGAASEHPNELTLAASLPLTSSDAARAAAWHRGYERAVADANRAGGVLLRATARRARVVLAIRDDHGEVSLAERAADELLASGAHALLATRGFTKMAAQAAVAQRYSRLYVVPAAAGPELKASQRPWVLVSPASATSEEDDAYGVASAALAALGSAPSLDPEAVRRAFVHQQPAADVEGAAPPGRGAQTAGDSPPH